MIYFPDEVSDPHAWPSAALGQLGYDADPAKLQLVLRACFDRLRRKGLPPDLEGLLSFYPLFAVLDGKDSSDYLQRVEPSVSGGRKIARALLDEIGIGNAGVDCSAQSVGAEGEVAHAADEQQQQQQQLRRRRSSPGRTPVRSTSGAPMPSWAGRASRSKTAMAAAETPSLAPSLTPAKAKAGVRAAAKTPGSIKWADDAVSPPPSRVRLHKQARRLSDDSE